MAWTEITRRKYQRDGQRYASDTTDAEWALIEKHLPPPAPCGRTRKTGLRDIVDAIFYIARSGCQWRLLPKDFPPYSTVQRYFYTWRDSGLWETINHVHLMDVREAAGREASPSAGVIDSQSVKTTEAGGPRGYAAEKMIKGRKRHVLTDTIGLPVGMIVHPADVQDRDGAPVLLASTRNAFPWLKHVFADGAYAGDKLKDALKEVGDWEIEIVKRSDAAKGFVLLPRRWVVERTFAWLNRNRRLAKDFEGSLESATTWLYIASVQLMSRRLAAACMPAETECARIIQPALLRRFESDSYSLVILKNRPVPQDHIWVAIQHSDGSTEPAKPIENLTQTEREDAVSTFIFSYVNYRKSYDVAHLQYNFDYVRFTTSPENGAQDEYIAEMSKSPNRPTEWLGTLGESRISDEQVSREGDNAFEVTYTQKIKTKEGTWLPDHHRRVRISYATSPAMPPEIARRLDPLKLVVTRWDDHPATYDPTAPGGRQ